MPALLGRGAGVEPLAHSTLGTTPGATAARRLLAVPEICLAPDLLFAEVGNTLWKRWCRRELVREEVDGILADLARVPLETVASRRLLGSAWEIAAELRRSVYDRLYLALARQRAALFVTGDRRLVRALAATSWARRVASIEELS